MSEETHATRIRSAHDDTTNGLGVARLLGAERLPGRAQAAHTTPVEVSVVTVSAQPIEELVEFLGEVEARRTVRVRSQVAGVIIARPFREGAEVRAGEVLYRIEASIYEAEHRERPVTTSRASSRSRVPATRRRATMSCSRRE
jgi:multidrug efflux pump subunit AcrA (membrane-fusion protein)